MDTSAGASTSARRSGRLSSKRSSVTDIRTTGPRSCSWERLEDRSAVLVIGIDAMGNIRYFLTLTLVGLVFTFWPTPSLAADKNIQPGQAIVTLAPTGSIDEINAEYRTSVLDQFQRPDGTNVYLLQFSSPTHTVKRVRHMLADPNVGTAVANKVITMGTHRPADFPGGQVEVADPPNDPTPYNDQPFLV